MDKSKVVALMKKVELYEGAKKLLIEILVEVITGVISKLISGGTGGRQNKPKRSSLATAA